MSSISHHSFFGTLNLISFEITPWCERAFRKGHIWKPTAPFQLLLMYFSNKTKSEQKGPLDAIKTPSHWFKCCSDYMDTIWSQEEFRADFR